MDDCLCRIAKCTAPIKLSISDHISELCTYLPLSMSLSVKVSLSSKPFPLARAYSTRSCHDLKRPSKRAKSHVSHQIALHLVLTRQSPPETNMLFWLSDVWQVARDIRHIRRDGCRRPAIYGPMDYACDQIARDASRPSSCRGC